MNKQQLLDLWKTKIQVITYRNLVYDIRRVQDWFRTNILPLPPAWQGAYDFKAMVAPRIPIEESGNIIFGGWSLLGPTKDYWTGWLPNGNIPVIGTNIKADFKQARIKTDICTGIMDNILCDIESKGLRLSRARLTVSKPSDILKWHTDVSDEDELIARIQFPIIATEKVFFMSQTDKWVMPSDGRLFVANTNHMHQVANNDSAIRINLIADIDVSQMPDDDFYHIHNAV